MNSRYPNVRWDEIMRIAQSQVVVTAEMNTEDGGKVSVQNIQFAGNQPQSDRKSKIAGTPKSTSKKTTS